MQLTATDLTMRFRRTFRISRGARDEQRNVLVTVEKDGVQGLGEASPSPYYFDQTADATFGAAVAMGGLLNGDPFDTEGLAERLAAHFPERPAARAAVDLAVHDWIGKKLGVPVARLFGLPTGLRKPTSFTLSIGDRASVREAAEEAAGAAILKVKLGGEDDIGALEAIREVSNAPLYVDANAGWFPEQAFRMCEELKEFGVVLIEQPLPPGQYDDLRKLRDITGIPIVADEDCRTSADIPALVGCVDGINIKLAKSGGLREALRMALIARALGLDVMLGTMVESSIGVAAAAQLLPLARWVDLDGPLLLNAEDDPCTGLVYEDGQIVMPEGPGLGVTLK